MHMSKIFLKSTVNFPANSKHCRLFRESICPKSLHCWLPSVWVGPTLICFGFASSFFFAKELIGNKFSLSCLSCLTFLRLFNISFLSYLFNFSSYFSSSTFSLCLFFCLLSLSRQRTLWQWTEISCTEFINMINDIDEMSWNTFNASSDFSDSMITHCHMKTSLHRNQNLLYSRSSLKSTLFSSGTRSSKIKTDTNQAFFYFSWWIRVWFPSKLVVRFAIRHRRII